MSKVLSETTVSAEGHRFPWSFFALAFGITWSVWIPFAVMSQVRGTPPSLLLNVGSFGPSIAGILLTFRNPDVRARSDFFRRLFSFGDIGIGGYLFIFVAIPALYLLAALVDCILRDAPLAFPYYSWVLSRFSITIQIALFLIIIGPLTEELGWRGFALDRLQARWSPLVSALVLGAIWSAWHLPLFFIKGTSWGDSGFGSFRFFLFLPYHLSLSVLVSWLYNGNRRSVAAAILAHLMANAAANVLPATPTAFPLATGLLAAAAASVIASGRLGTASLKRN